MLDTIANLAEILAGLAIVYSAIKVLPIVDNLSAEQFKKPAPIPDAMMSELEAQLRKAGYAGSAVRSATDLIKAIIESSMASLAASIHIRHISKKLIRVSYRIDGRPKHVLEFPSDHYRLIKEAILKLDDGSNKRNPQEANVPVDFLSERWVDYLKGTSVRLRVHFADTNEGESVHLVTSSSMSAMIGLETLGIEGLERRALDSLLAKLENADRDSARGLVVFVSPTQQGKTVSLYNLVFTLLQKDIAIASIEDPVEVDLPGLNQMEIQEVPGYRFVDRFRHGALVGDLDALMIGEVTSPEIAKAAVSFANHRGMVLTTLTEADATIGFRTFRELAGDKAITTPMLVVAQLLVRRLCVDCKTICTLDPKDEAFVSPSLHKISAPSWYQPTGCSNCVDGYRGRIAAFEVYEYDGLDGSVPRTLRENLVRLAASGVTSFEELRRVIGSPGNVDKRK